MRLLALCQSSFTTALQLHQPRTRNVIAAKLAGEKKSSTRPTPNIYSVSNSVLLRNRVVFVQRHQNYTHDYTIQKNRWVWFLLDSWQLLYRWWKIRAASFQNGRLSGSHSWIGKPKLRQATSLELMYQNIWYFVVVIQSRRIHVGIVNSKHSLIAAFIHILANLFDELHRTAEFNINMSIEFFTHQWWIWIVNVNVYFVVVCPPLSAFLWRYIGYSSAFVIVALVKSLGELIVHFPSAIQIAARAINHLCGKNIEQ